MKTEELLDKFGKGLFGSVRDTVYRQFMKIISGELKAKSCQLLHDKLSKLNDLELETVKSAILDSIDASIHHFLWMIEQNENIDLVMKDSEEEKAISLREISDGLCGELYTEDGWIESFSKYPPSIK